MQRAVVAFATLAGIALATATPAQELSDAEVLERFGLQKEVMQAARGGLGTTRGLGTRGLSLVTLEEVTPEAEPAPEAGVSVASTPETTSPAVTATTPMTTSTPVDPNKPIQVAVFQPDLQVNVRVRFGFDSAAIDRAEMPKLEQMCRVMKQATDVGKFRIIGHTDASGSEAYNESLSVLRAEEVARYLTAECGIEASRLEVMGLGERLLYDAERPDAETNRRVEFQVVS
jgi:outer membrane protein OmpA-like peptidoglycan-associated protein